MRCLHADEMRELDRCAIEDWGVPGVVLMENAGLQVVRLIAELWRGRWDRRRVVICCGKGNNGGDGYVIARHLANRGVDVRICATAVLDALTGDARTNADITAKIGLPRTDITGERVPPSIIRDLEAADLIVDALLGTGIKGDVRGPARAVIRAVNRADTPVVAVDLPSGVDADTGHISNPTVCADWTVTFALPKVGLCQYPGAACAGEVWVADIGIPDRLLAAATGPQLLTPESVRAMLPPRPADGHKGTFGRCLVVGGSTGMSGAVQLAGLSALRSGAGLVAVALPESLNGAFEAAVRECTSVPLPSAHDGLLTVESLDHALAAAAVADAVAVGPGVSQDRRAAEFVRRLVAEIRSPMVIDADGLNAYTGRIDELAAVDVPLVLTPHPGELGRLLNLTAAEIQGSREAAVREAARRSGAVVVLKGAGTLVATPPGELYINTTGNTGMATGGSGDVLTGVVVALLARGMAAGEAAATAVFIHGMAGDIAVTIAGEGLIAGDLTAALPQAWDCCRRQVTDARTPLRRVQPWLQFSVRDGGDAAGTPHSHF